MLDFDHFVFVTCPSWNLFAIRSHEADFRKMFEPFCPVTLLSRFPLFDCSINELWWRFGAYFSSLKLPLIPDFAQRDFCLIIMLFKNYGVFCIYKLAVRRNWLRVFLKRKQILGWTFSELPNERRFTITCGQIILRLRLFINSFAFLIWNNWDCVIL